jgi:hypothetical protein
MRIPKLKTGSQIALLLISGAVAAAPLFDADEMLEAELRGPLREMVADRRDPEVRTFELLASDAAISVEARVRGHSRLKLCDFPPLRLDFSASATEGTVFAGQEKLKLVSHCNARSTYEDNVIEEYAAYRILSLLTEFAFEVRLLRMRYVDTTRPNERPLERYAFVIESLDALAARTDGVVVQREALVKSSLDRTQLASVFVFQYLIGNTDWSLVTPRGEEFCCHNGELLERGDRLFYIPYDFDFSGLVNARYAKPQPDLGIKTVKSRVYRGYCLEGLDLEAAILDVLDKEAEILELLEQLPGGEKGAGSDRVRYVERFFEEARDVEGLARKFERSCVG